MSSGIMGRTAIAVAAVMMFGFGTFLLVEVDGILILGRMVFGDAPFIVLGVLLVLGGLITSLALLANRHADMGPSDARMRLVLTLVICSVVLAAAALVLVPSGVKAIAVGYSYVMQAAEPCYSYSPADHSRVSGGVQQAWDSVVGDIKCTYVVDDRETIVYFRQMR